MNFAIFDIETRIDKRLVAESLYRGEGLDEEAAYARMRDELIADRGTDFFPLSVHIPVSIAIGSVGPDHSLQSLESLAVETYSEEALVREFFERVERFTGCLVTFNGRLFDLPVLELQALRHGIAAPKYFGSGSPHRRRYVEDKHYDLHEFITNFGTSRVRGGFDLLLRMMGLPAKGDVDGSQVQRLWEEGKLEEIHRYCRRDVLQTYRLFLRVELMRGRIERPLCDELLATANSKFAAELES
jgi:3'-5' exonuclease